MNLIYPLIMSVTVNVNTYNITLHLILFKFCYFAKLQNKIAKTSLWPQIKRKFICFIIIFVYQNLLVYGSLQPKLTFTISSHNAPPSNADLWLSHVVDDSHSRNWAFQYAHQTDIACTQTLFVKQITTMNYPWKLNTMLHLDYI